MPSIGIQTDAEDQPFSIDELFSGRKVTMHGGAKAGKPKERFLSPEEMLQAIHEPGLPESCE
jgi:hypothetical protein